MDKKEKNKKMKNNYGITLIAIVVTIIVLIILAGISINLLFGNNGIITKTKEAAQKYAEEEARERLELKLAELQMEKDINNAYNSGEYIDEKLAKDDMIAIDNIVIVDDWQFLIDRDTLKIMANLGKGSQNNNVQIEITQDEALNYGYTKVILTVRVSGLSQGLKSVTIDGTPITTYTEENGVYIVTKEVTENKAYTVIVKGENDEFNIGKIEVTNLTENMEIRKKEDFALFSQKVNEGQTFEGKTVTLMDNIDLQGSQENQWIVAGNDTIPFKGTFDGNNKTIENIYINSEAGGLGLIYNNSGTIKNLTIKGEITGKGENIGGLCSINNGIIENCTNYINITNNSEVGLNVGGLVGEGIGGSIKKCTNYGNIKTSFNRTGGIVGCTTTGCVIQNCTNYGKIEGVASVAGISGRIDNSTISRCENNGVITGSDYDIGGIGGLVYTSTILECRNNNSITGTAHNAGGIVGTGYDLNIIECYNKAPITGRKYAGGIVGNNTRSKRQV